MTFTSTAPSISQTQTIYQFHTRTPTRAYPNPSSGLNLVTALIIFSAVLMAIGKLYTLSVFGHYHTEDLFLKVKPETYVFGGQYDD